ncbi:MAG: hypothetical protein KTR32_22470 [Granulosicoccus sp.]|nr:hypothetical protein [Granulosicoccus sp.]
MQNKMRPQTLKSLIQCVHSETGITIPASKHIMLERRITKRIKATGTESYEGYLRYLSENKAEREYFVDAVTTNETYFFRTPRIWQYFVDDFIPQWHKNNTDGRSLNIWSGAASTGAEVYSIGICCEEYKSKNPDFNYKILGTDISNSVLEKAKEGIYHGRAIRKFQETFPELFEKHMIPADHGYSVSPEIRSSINFELHNLFDTLRCSDLFDIVFLRNVLIYFSREDQEKVIKNMELCLNHPAHFIIGESESVSEIAPNFSLIAPLIYVKSTNSSNMGLAA